MSSSPPVLRVSDAVHLRMLLGGADTFTNGLTETVMLCCSVDECSQSTHCCYCLSKQAVDTLRVKERKVGACYLRSQLEWQPHASDVLTEGAFTFTTCCHRRQRHHAGPQGH